MTISEKLYFIRQLRNAFTSIGAVIPTSRYAARAMAAECARRSGPKTILEVGAGTGAITSEIIKHLGPEDRLVLVEINPDFVAYLRSRFEREPAFQRVRDRVTLHTMSVTELEGTEVFDCIVSAIPFTSCPPQLTGAILERYRALLKPDGVLTYIEYAFLRKLKRQLGGASEEAAAIDAIVNPCIEQYQFRRDMVWRNVPPAWIRHLRFVDPRPEEALRLAPLEHTHRVAAGPVGIADEAIPSVGLLIGASWLLRRWRGAEANGRPAFWALPLLLAGLVAWFFRDPPRRVDSSPEVAYAASDGRVLSVERVRDQRLGDQEWLRVAVFLSLLDPHINRAPIAGKVVRIIHEDGGYAPADHPSAEHNVAQYTVIKGARGSCVVAQRTGLVARRIVNWSSVGELLAQGDRYGLIRFGSRTDVYLPADQVQACVAPGDYVRAGTTVIARYIDRTTR